MSKLNLYAVKDKVSNRFLSVSPADSDASFVRASLLSILMDYPIRDVTLYRVGTFDDKTGRVSRHRPRYVAWDSYKIPETFANEDSKDVSFEKFDEFAKKQKEAFVEAVAKKQSKENME